MTEETLNEGAAAPAEEDLRSTIEAAIERQRDVSTDTGRIDERPAGEVEGKPARVRGEDGKFAAQEKPQEGKPAAPAADVQPKVEAGQEAAQGQQTALRPPGGWSPESKAAFNALPQEVKNDIVKREAEINQGFAKLQEYKSVERFAESARQSGTTLERALTNFTNWEGAIHRDPVAAIMHMAGNLKIHPQQLAQGILQRLNTGQQQANPGMQPEAQIHPALLKEIQALKSTVGAHERERVEQQKAAVNQQVDAFWSDPKHKHVDDVTDIMISLINQAHAKGEKADLPSIYDTACWMHPTVRQMLINEQMTSPAVSNAAKAQAASQARAASKAVTGAPSRGSAPGSTPPSNESLRDTIRRSIEDQRGA